MKFKVGDRVVISSEASPVWAGKKGTLVKENTVLGYEAWSVLVDGYSKYSPTFFVNYVEHDGAKEPLWEVG